MDKQLKYLNETQQIVIKNTTLGVMLAPVNIILSLLLNLRQVNVLAIIPLKKMKHLIINI